MVVLNSEEERILVLNFKLTPYEQMRQELKLTMSMVKNKISKRNLKFGCATRNEIFMLAKTEGVEFKRQATNEIVLIRLRFSRKVTK